MGNTLRLKRWRITRRESGRNWTAINKVQPHRAVRQGDWKYIDEPSGGRYLHDLSSDIAEQVNLASINPDKADAMARLLDQWEADMDPPLYDQRPPGRKK